MSVSLRGPLARRGAAIISTAAVIGLAACSSSSAGGGQSPAGTAASSTAGAGLAYAKAEVAKYSAASVPPSVTSLTHLPDLKGKTVWYIPLVAAVPVISVTGNAMADALGKLGATVHTCDGGALPTTIAGCMNNAISQHAAAVVTGFFDYTLVPAGFQELEKAHIPVLVGGAAPTGGQTSSTQLAFFDTTKTSNFRSALAADMVISDSDGRGDVLVTRLTDSSTTRAAAQSVLTEFKARCPGCTIHTIDIQSADLSKYPAAVSSALASDPNIGYLVPPVDSYDTQAVAGVRSAGFGGKVKIVTLGAALSGLQEVAAGTALADISNSVVFQGWAFANALLQMLSGQVPSPLGSATMRIFTKGNVTGLKLTPAEYGTNDWFGSDSLEQGFLTAWGVK